MLYRVCIEYVSSIYRVCIEYMGDKSKKKLGDFANFLIKKILFSSFPIVKPLITMQK